MMANSSPVGFTDPVHDSQATFRTLLEAMSRPGSVHQCHPTGLSDATLPPTVAAVLLTLADHETTVWLDPALPLRSEAADWVRFATGARVVENSANATFAVVADAAAMPPFTEFAQGSLEYPDRSTTLLTAVDALQAGRSELPGLELEGPGVEGTAEFHVSPCPEDFVSRLAANRERFPCGIDLILCAPTSIAALPRSTRVRASPPIDGDR